MNEKLKILLKQIVINGIQDIFYL